MTDLTIAIAAIVGAAAGGTMGLLMSWAAGMYDRRPYSSAAIAFRASEKDAASKIINPLVWEDPPQQFNRLDPGSVQRGNGSSGPNLTDPSTDRPWFPQ